MTAMTFQAGRAWERARDRVRLGIVQLCGELVRLRGGKTEGIMARLHRLVKQAQADYRDILAAVKKTTPLEAPVINLR